MIGYLFIDLSIYRTRTHYDKTRSHLSLFSPWVMSTFRLDVRNLTASTIELLWLDGEQEV